MLPIFELVDYDILGGIIFIIGIGRGKFIGGGGIFGGGGILPMGGGKGGYLLIWSSCNC